MTERSFDEAGQSLLHAEQAAERRVKNIWRGFADFALQDNVLEVATGLILAAAFTTVVTSFVGDILLPPISLLPFLNKNLNEKFAVLKRGPNHSRNHGYNTIKIAHEDGAVVMAYGTFINKVINFIGVGLSLYLIANLYEWISKDSVIKSTIRCKYCRKLISQKAKRCVNCTSWQDGREDSAH